MNLSSDIPSELHSQAPWPGLAAYDEDSSDFFFGRDEEAAELFRLIRLRPLTALYGKSGLGKTSLLQAGLYPLLRKGHYLAIHLRIDFSDSAPPPFQQVMQRLKDELDKAKADYSALAHSEYDVPTHDEGLWEYLHRKGYEFWTQDNYPLTPVLVFDQFEELFSRSGSNIEQITRVFDGLEDLIENLIPTEVENAEPRSMQERLDPLSQRYRIVLSFREDFLPEVKTWEQRVPSLLRNCLRLYPMSRERAVEAVTLAGKEVLDADVAPSIVDLVGGKRDHAADAANMSEIVIEPVLLSLCCSRLNSRRAKDAKIDRALVEHTGPDILDGFYRDALADQAVQGPPDAALFIEDYLIQGDFRGAFPKEEALGNKWLTEKQLSALTDKHRLLRLVHHPDTTRVELIHDRLVPVVRKTRDERRIKKQRQQELLAERQAAAKALAEEQRRATERAQADAVRLRKSRDQLLGLLLMTEAQAILSGTRPGGSELGFLKLLAAYRIAPHIEIEGVILAHVLAFQRMEEIVQTGSPVSTVAFSPDGTRLASGGYDGTVRLWNAKTKQALGAPLQGHEGSVWSVAFSPDETRLASGGYDGTVRLWNAQSGQRIGKPMQGHENGQVRSVAFSPDGTRLVSGGGDKTLRLWNVQTGQRIGQPMQGHEGDVLSVAFSPDTTRLASGSADRTLLLWDVQTGQRISQPIRGHESTVWSVAFSSDGTRLVSGGSDETLRLWDVQTGQPIGQPLKGHEFSVWSVAFSPDGTCLVSGGEDNTLRLWPAPKVWPHLLCACAKRTGDLTRNMSRKEWREQVSPDIEYHEQCLGLPIPPDTLSESQTSAATSKTQ